MSGQKPSFITGATAKIKVGTKTFAYASDVSYGIAVDTIPVETMGRYEAVANEPVNYSVAGDLSVVRYTRIAQANGIPKTNANGNGLGNVSDNGTRSDELDPSKLLISKTWDLHVFQKEAGGSGAEFITITDCRFTRKSSSLSKRGLLVDRLSFVGILASDDSYTAGLSGDDDLST